MAEDFRVDTRFFLYHKTVMVDGVQVPVYGMGRFSVRPRHLGVGTSLIRSMERIAERDGKRGLVAFCADSLLDFYLRKCGWFLCGRYEELNIIASRPFLGMIVTEKW